MESRYFWKTLWVILMPIAVRAQNPTLTSPTSPPAICSGATFSYLPTSSAPQTSFTWVFVPSSGITAKTTQGQGAIASVLIDNTNAPVNATFQVTLTTATGSSTANVVVTVNPPPTAGFTLNQAAACLTGNNFTFTNTSTGAPPLSYFWSAGDRTNSLATNLTHTYPTSGQFPVQLTTRNAYNCFATATQVVTVYPTPLADFTDAYANGAYQFTNTSVGSPTSYSWNFGDGTTSNTANPAHTFAAGGTYPVVLTVTNAQGCATSMTEDITTPTGGAAGFTVGPSAGICQGATFAFTDRSAGAPVSYQWNFGDGTPFGAGAAPTHTYASAGAFTVTETVSYAGSSSTVSQLVNVYPSPNIGLLMGGTTVCAGSSSGAIIFQPGNDALQFSWTVSDPSIGLQNGSGTYIPAFTVANATPNPVASTLTVSAVSPYGCPISDQNRTFTIKPSPALTDSLPMLEVCAGTTITVPAFTANLAGTTFAWTTTDSLTGLPSSGTGDIAPFVAVNNDSITLTTGLRVVPQFNGCSGVTKEMIYTVDPVPTLDTSAGRPGLCSGTVLSYVPKALAIGTTYAWSRAVQSGISQGAASGNDSIHEVLSSTSSAAVSVVYQYQLTAGNCSSSEPLTVQVLPVPALSGPLDTAVCSGALFRYVPGSATSGASFSWTRAAVSGVNNAPGAGADSIHEVLSNAGLTAVAVQYQYTLSAAGCSQTQDLAVEVNPQPLISLVSPDTQAVCPGGSTQPVTFNVQPAGTSYAWTTDNPGIGLNAGSGSGAVPAFAGVNAGNAPVVAHVRAIAQTAAGCVSTPSGLYTYVVNPAPVATIAEPASTLWCPGTPVSLSASGGNTYQWFYGGSVIGTSSGLAANDSGTYAVQAANTFGCADTADISLSLYPQPQASFIFQTSCLDTPVVFTNTSTEALNLPVTYSWSNGIGGTSTAVSPTFTYQTAGQYTVSLTVTPQGCAAQAATASMPISITTPLPGEKLVDQFVQSGKGASISGRSFTGATYDWMPASGLSDPLVVDPTALLTAPQAYTIAMTMPTGCVTTDTLRVDLIGADVVYIPGGFTPNGDGRNDLFVIAGLNNYPGSSLAVFDRWGKKVYYSSDYQNNWDGGGVMAGTYVYVLELKIPNGGKEYRGTLVVMR
ncbi:PKD domain-containing protein [Dinghuibacter silviterrae]|uniref:Gliding motility-associated-like protein n=1 Tax=Dinghuibacter silviterrae TaxID=1539049 RepID=A0A4R8DV54_9BACT|nr:PKD domain-containing protein [Dinghuibacter silviterrae]TDX01798.1 gliding motility-associated-like protein [Dinghuibacter silviterrae]